MARQASEALQTADVKAGVSATSNKPVPPTSKASTTNSKVAAARRITSPVLDDIGANNDASGSAAATTSDNDVYSACKTLLGALFGKLIICFLCHYLTSLCRRRRAWIFEELRGSFSAPMVDPQR